MPLTISQTIPIFRIFDVAKAKDFYLDYLGFHLDWEHRFEENFPLYMQVSRDGLVLHLSEHHGDGCPGANVFVRMTGLDDFHREISSKSYSYLRPGIVETFHGSRQVNLTDPFGNRLHMDESLEAVAPE